MAIVQVVAVWDCAMQAFARPMTVPAVGVAMRSFMDEVNNKESALSKHPEDYELHHLCSFDESTGLFSAISPDVASACLVRGKDCVRSE